MTVFNFYIFDRNGTCLYYAEWNRKKQSGISKEEEFKLMYGMIFSIKSFVNRISPTDMKDGFMNFKTSKYKLHFFETQSGLKFIMNTDLNVGSVKETLQLIYSSIYVEYVVKNPLCCLDQPITSELFKAKLDDFVRGLPIFPASVS
ncbi:trafficking protein particle complex subunit 1-like isoform X2 [Haliotis rubra]|uniref:trafficking protein particle complex subunit 1-like n=1 Tax=Haliotis asinina TaxID=109174 RepID=UPI001EE5173C|nr:trafficking protein particle complex subunit 1-like isoform X1 [Haliotis rubra]XP_046546288.1 trafficking protein particle complex subunit 1-like isoform X2 [Haliotis rubra]